MHNATFVWKIPNSPWESLARATWQFFDLIVNTYIHIYVYIANEWSTVSSQGCVGDQKVFLISPFFTSTAGQVPHRLEGGGGVSINYPLAQFQTPARFPAATHERLESTVPFFFFFLSQTKSDVTGSIFWCMALVFFEPWDLCSCSRRLNLSVKRSNTPLTGKEIPGLNLSFNSSSATREQQ